MKYRMRNSGQVVLGINFFPGHIPHWNEYEAPSNIALCEEWLDSRNNPGWFRQEDAGGYFMHRIKERRPFISPPTKIRGNGDIYYLGSVWTPAPNPPDIIGDGTQFGAAAYAAMKPTKFDYSLFQYVYELKDLGHQFLSLQQFWQNLLNIGGLAQNFLGQVFGWNPLIDDTFRMIEKQQQLQKRIEWLIRNQGKWVPRKVTLRDLTTRQEGSWETNYGSFYPIFVTQSYPLGPPKRKTDIVRKDKIWATAQFKYFLPDVGPGVKLDFALRRALQGFHSIRLYEVYRVMPWTWLVDWCFGVARLLENCDPGVADRIAARRFFVMREQEVISVQSSVGSFRTDGAPITFHGSAWSRSLYQTRIRGLPFYPGNPNELSDMQLSILGALGLSKL